MSQLAFPGRVSREDPELSERQRWVFDALVALHGRTARPVGSESLARLGGVSLSPASIRNALMVLESMGLLERQHSSGGRIPTARGYAGIMVLMPSVITQSGTSADVQVTPGMVKA